jgi:hypothetical protein
MATSAASLAPIDLEHVRRGQRVIELLVMRFGVAHFLEKATRSRGRELDRLSKRACEDALSLAKSWVERRTGRHVNESELSLWRRALRKMLVRHIREGSACVRSR